ncbi:spore coat polysaccharide biosynthesis protein SpsK [Paenibacillus sp. TCA20]|uniref:dTDP-4-dehydrorhamnose reductase n=1 Tax=Paenibacillus sp. TCA20 TaxID=1499968 RepID=UPI0004DA54A2|nr:dTDP-4-dehydrorhamnose reductase [Paenibacillus sp. TCA20]GAK43443.1 spore coat polysaccharide biosynthesis protein SpsK [Paenibacillus sp. TCA20]
MRILVSGAGGQLGKDVVAIFSQAGHEVMGCERNDLDITDQEQCNQVIGSFKPDAIIHCAAYTAVDQAESDVDGAYLINAVGTRNIAVASEKVGAKLIYVSTDYVFDGKSDKPYQEYDSTNPQSIYGKSKRAGEILTQSLSSRYFVVRTSWVYGAHGNNFVKTMLRLAQEKPELNVVDDQKGSPTYTIHLAKFLLELSETEKYGIYHASGTGECTWYEFTKFILEEASSAYGVKFKVSLSPCGTDQFPRPAPRPANSVLDHISIRTNGLEEFPHWKMGLQEFLRNHFINLNN